jgi:polysaccharide export outer membrane protein
VPVSVKAFQGGCLAAGQREKTPGMKRSWLLLCAFCACACSDVGKFVWVQDYQETATPARSFVIGPGDVLNVRMFGQEQFTTRARVRNDGKITLQLLGDVIAAGYTPTDLGKQIETRYRDYVKVPAVTVSVDEVKPLILPVAGEVGHQGMITADRGSTLLEVLLLAGGLNDFAHKDRIFVLRGSPPATRIRFAWKDLIRGNSAAAAFEMRPGDTVVVE